MKQSRLQPRSTAATWCWVLAFAIGALNFAWQGKIGMDLSDEGFLYYGVLRVRAGEIPLADFQSYEPYRYYWCAAWTWLLGDSVYAVRAAAAFFGAIGLGFGLLAVARVVQRPWLLLLVGAAMASSNVLWYRQFETAVALTAIWIAVRVAESANPKSTLAAGALVGLIAGFGRNHGLYSAIAILAVIVVVSWRFEGRARLSMLISYFAGIVVGYLPIIAHLLFAPGYFAALASVVTHELLAGRTNIALPVPWPWLVPIRTLAWPDATLRVGVGILFALVPLTYALAVAVLRRRFDVRDPAHRLLLAAVSVGVPYLHHAFSRADTVHLLEGSQGFIPTVLGLITVAARSGAGAPVFMRPILSVSIVLAFLVPNALHQPRFYFERAPAGAYAAIDANGSALQVPHPIANIITALREIKASNMKPSETMLLAPHWPMAYALLRLRAPFWEIYHLFPRSESFQRAEIAALEHHHVIFAVFSDATIDNRADMRMSMLTPLLYRYLRDNYALVGGPAPFPLYRRKTPLPLSKNPIVSGENAVN